MVSSSSVDIGYSWVILFATFCINFLQSTNSTSGVLFVEFRQYFRLSSVITSGINTAEIIVFTITCLPAGVLVQRYGCRRIAILAAICGAVSYLSGAFVPEFAYLYFTYGVLIGVATSLFGVNGQVIVQQYFDRRRALANSVFMTAFSLAGASFPPLSQFLIGTYGWRGTLILLSGFWVQILPLAALLRPHKSARDSSLDKITLDDGRKEKAAETEMTAMNEQDIINDAFRYQSSFQSHNKLYRVIKRKCFAILCEIFDTSLICRGSFIVYTLFRMSSTLVRVIPDFFLPACAISSGVDKMEAAFLVTIVGIAQAVTRLVTGFLNDYLQSDRVTVCSVSGVVAGIVFVSCLFLWHHTHFVIYSVLSGISTGIFSAIEIPTAVDLIGQEKLPCAFGIVSFWQGVVLIISMPLSATLADITGRYKPIYLLCGIVHIAVSGLLFVVVFVARRRQSQKNKSIDSSPESQVETLTT